MTTLQIERRMFTSELRVERRADGAPQLVGHAAVFNSTSEDLGGFREIVAPGAFAQTITEDDIRALFNHDPNHVLGRNRAGTLRLREDNRGLAFEIDLPDTQTARDLAASIERGDISGNSFGFNTLEDRWERLETGELRTLIRVRLFDVSPVTYPAYSQTDVALRSLETWRAEQNPAQAAEDPRDVRLDILAPGLRRK
jgi:HK97 family phage prohead protease